MFDMGFTEILFIAIIAIIFIGPENLPSTMAKIAKFFRNFKQSIDKAKREFEEEINISQLKDEALKYKQELEAAREELSAFKQIAQKESQEIRENLASLKEEFKIEGGINHDLRRLDDFDDFDDFKDEDINKKSKEEKKNQESGFKHLKGNNV